MLSATLLGVFFIPLLFVVVRRLFPARPARQPEPPLGQEVPSHA
jgi:hypothetical protein